MSCELVSTATEVGVAEWAALLPPDGLYVSREWSAVTEGDRMAQTSYVLARDSAQALVGLLPVHIMRYQLSPTYRPSTLLGPDVDKADAENYAILGARSGFHNAVAVSPTLGPRARADVIRLLLRCALDVATERGAPGVIWPYLAEDAVHAVSAAVSGARWLKGLPVAAVSVADGWDAHVAALDPHRRRVTRQELRRFSQAGLAVRVSHEINADWFGQLVSRHEAKYGGRVTPGGIAAMVRRMADSGIPNVYFVAEIGSEPVAATHAIATPGQLWTRLIGLDDDGLESAFNYFVLAFHAPMRWLAEHGGGTLHMGPYSLKAKTLRGAEVAGSAHLVLDDPGQVS